MNFFRKSLIEYIHNSEIINFTDIDILLNNLNFIDDIYRGICYNLYLINDFLNQKGININFIFREEGLPYSNYAHYGFYKFKNSFYEINKI